MNIVYLSSVSSQKRFDELFGQKIIKKMPQAQKYHHLLLEGLYSVAKDHIVAISSSPIATGNRKFYSQQEIVENGIKYIYPAFSTVLFVRQLMLIINSFRLLARYTSKETIVICDVLNETLCFSARLLRLFKRYKLVAIVTDVPGHTSGARAKTASRIQRFVKKVATKITKSSLAKYDGYLLLTEAMNGVVNLKHKPYIVIEGHSDSSMSQRNNDINEKSSNKTIMYAGGTHKEFGIKLLVDAFLSLGRKDWSLNIYGDGNYQNELVRIASTNDNVNYFGLKPNSEIVEAQIHSWLLVNPRITDADYVKYSFPSKTLECMASGTPLLTTRLAGMPKDYYPYVYLFDDENIDGFRRVLGSVMSKGKEELHKKGMEAKSFAINEKNNISQATKFYNFLTQL